MKSTESRRIRKQRCYTYSQSRRCTFLARRFGRDNTHTVGFCSWPSGFSPLYDHERVGRSLELLLHLRLQAKHATCLLEFLNPERSIGLTSLLSSYSTLLWMLLFDYLWYSTYIEVCFIFIHGLFFFHLCNSSDFWCQCSRCSGCQLSCLNRGMSFKLWGRRSIWSRAILIAVSSREISSGWYNISDMTRATLQWH